MIGHSLGGHVALQSLAKMLNKGIVLIRTPLLSLPLPLNDAFLQCPVIPLLYQGDITKDQSLQMAITLTGDTSFSDLIPKTDPKTREFLVKSLPTNDYANHNFRDESIEIQKLVIPMVVVHEANDPIVNLDYLNSLSIPTLWRKKVQVILDVGHATQ